MSDVRGFQPKIARIELSKIDDSQGEQLVDHFGIAGEKHTKVHRPQQFGLSAHPPVGSTGVVISLSGERSKSIVMSSETPAKRPKNLPEGAAVLYDSAGNIIYAKVTGIEVTAKSGTVTIKDPSGATVHLPNNGKVLLGSTSASLGVMLDGGIVSTKVFGIP